MSTDNVLEMILKKKKLKIKSQFLIDRFLLIEINRELVTLLAKIVNYLTTEDDDANQTGLLYDQLAKTRSVILNKYEKRLSQTAIEKYMKKIRFTAFELRKRLINYKRRGSVQKSR